jgi:hypothetical protein
VFESYDDKFARMEKRMADRKKGLYDKYKVTRIDGEDRREGLRGGPPGRHYGCEYFVLDLNHDPHALPAILAYASSAEEDGYRALAKDLRDKVAELAEDLGLDLQDLQDLHRDHSLGATEGEL